MGMVNDVRNRTTIFPIVNNTLIGLMALACAVPLLLLLMVSVTNEQVIEKYGYSFIPKEFSLDAYRHIFSSGGIIVNSYLISIFITLVGTITALVITAMAAYALSNKKVVYRDQWALFFYFTMLFNGGLVPWYLVNRTLHVFDNILALLIPSLLFSAFNMFLVRNYMKGLPDELRESAFMDGAGDFTIAFRIYIPLSVPVLAAVALFYGLGYWNDWWNAIMLVSNRKLYPLQYMLFALQSNAQMLADLQSRGITSGITLPKESLKMATVIVTIGPILLLYPFLQRYFIKGLIIGSVKG